MNTDPTPPIPSGGCDRLEVTRIATPLRSWLEARATEAGLTLSEFVGRLLCREAGLTPQEGLLPRQPVGRKPRYLTPGQVAQPR
jgi:hypothetical protein